MLSDFAGAIIAWREQVDLAPGGLAAFEQSATVSTMLFGCHRWLASANAELDHTRIRIEAIKAELEEWLDLRGLQYRG